MNIEKICANFYDANPSAEAESWSAVTDVLAILEKILTRDQYMKIEAMVTGIHTITESAAFKCGFNAALAR